MTRRIRIGLAGLGRMGRIHAASRSGRCRGRTVTVEPQRSGDNVLYTVKQENR